MNNLRILITGGSGFIGTHFINLLLSKNIEILNIDIQKPKITSHNTFWKQHDIKEFYQLIDIFSEFVPTHVLHLAAKANLNGASISDFPDNTIGSQNVVNCVKKLASIKRFILTSTQYVVRPGVYPESDEYYQPYTAYGESKAESERVLRKANLNCAWTIIRPTNIWGPWHTAFPNELWRFLSKRYYFHPGFEPIRKYYGYVGNAVEQIYRLLCEASDHEVDRGVFYVTDPPIDNAEWMNAFSIALSGRPMRRIPRKLWGILGATGSVIKSMGGSFPIDSDRYFRLVINESIPYEKMIEIAGEPNNSLGNGVMETVNWLVVHHPELVKA